MRHRLSWLGVGLVLVIGACDHKPAPKKQPIVVKATVPTPSPVGAAPGATGTAATGSTAPGAAPTAAVPGTPASPVKLTPVGAASGDSGEACMQIGIRIAELAIAASSEQTRPQLEQARTEIVRSSAEACVKGEWNAEVRGCFLGAKTLQELDGCRTKIPPPPPTAAN